MGALDPRTPVDDLHRLAAELGELARRLDLLEAPTGTSAYRTVAKLEALVADIQAQLDAWAAGRRTDAATDTIIDAKIAAAIAAVLGGNVSIAGNLSVAGALTAGGAVTLPDVFNTDVAALGGSRKARSAAVEHRRWTGAEVIGSADRRRERNREQTARRAAARRAAREQAAEAEGGREPAVASFRASPRRIPAGDTRRG